MQSIVEGVDFSGGSLFLSGVVIVIVVGIWLAVNVGQGCGGNWRGCGGIVVVIIVRALGGGCGGGFDLLETVIEEVIEIVSRSVCRWCGAGKNSSRRCRCCDWWNCSG